MISLFVTGFDISATVQLAYAWAFRMTPLKGVAKYAAICTGAMVAVNALASFELHRWFSEYGQAYGGFGVGLALMAAVALIDTFWVWIAAVMGIYWERKAGSAVVARMEELSAERARSKELPAAGPAAAG